MEKALIILDNLSIGYNGQPVLSGISLSIARAGFTAILGANGSGKSTLLKTMLGLIPPVAGRIDTRAPPRIRLRPSIHSVRPGLSADWVRGCADGRLWTHPPGAFYPAG